MRLVGIVIALLALTVLSGVTRAAFEAGRPVIGTAAFVAASAIVVALGFWLGRERGR